MSLIWQTTRFRLDLSRPRVMGIVNVTPDSFSDGGAYWSLAQNVSAAMARCEHMLAEGADLLDIGGESTRPGAQPVPIEEELARVLPVLRHAVTLGVPISIDTYKPAVMQAVLDLGTDVINDVWAFRQSGAVEVVARHGGCGICLMHMHREPQTMQTSPMQGNIVPQVLSFLRQSAETLQSAGVDRQRIVLDVGIGFGKTVAQNFSLLARQHEFLATGYPLMAAWSRKSSLAALTGLGSSTGAFSMTDANRLVSSVSAALLAVERGARLVRVHDVRETAQALRVWEAATS